MHKTCAKKGLYSTGSEKKIKDTYFLGKNETVESLLHKFNPRIKVYVEYFEMLEKMK